VWGGVCARGERRETRRRTREGVEQGVRLGRSRKELPKPLGECDSGEDGRGGGGGVSLNGDGVGWISMWSVGEQWASKAARGVDVVGVSHTWLLPSRRGALCWGRESPERKRQRQQQRRNSRKIQRLERLVTVKASTSRWWCRFVMESKPAQREHVSDYREPICEVASYLIEIFLHRSSYNAIG
jgi:hypothetical protein